MRDTLKLLFLSLWALLTTVPGTAQMPVPAPSQLKVGAAKILLTPPAEIMVAPFNKVADDLYVRAVVIESGGRRAVMIVADVPMMQDQVADKVTRLVADKVHAPVANVLLATSHTHNVMRVDPNTVGTFLPGSQKFVDWVTAKTLVAVEQAEAHLRPARIGMGKGKANLVANRNQWSVPLGRYIDGIDRTGNEPIDLSLGVLKFEGLDGKPIAIVMNYAIEPVIAQAMEGQISGDVPGAAARYVEKRVDGAVALFTVSAAGSPIYRIHPDSIYGAPDPQELIRAMGTVLGEEAISVAKDLRTSGAMIPIGGMLEKLQCPGKLTTPLNLPNRCAHTPDSKLPACDFKDADAPPTLLNMGVLRIGDLVIVQANANVTPALGRKLMQSTPAANTWIVALTYGPMHYVMDDAAYALNTYEATASAAKKGCAQQAFLGDSLKMMETLR